MPADVSLSVYACYSQLHLSVSKYHGLLQTMPPSSNVKQQLSQQTLKTICPTLLSKPDPCVAAMQHTDHAMPAVVAAVNMNSADLHVL